VAECLPSKCKALSSTPVPEREREREKRDSSKNQKLWFYKVPG
jgi:hypothetical protein